MAESGLIVSVTLTYSLENAEWTDEAVNADMKQALIEHRYSDVEVKPVYLTRHCVFVECIDGGINRIFLWMPTGQIDSATCSSTFA